MGLDARMLVVAKESITKEQVLNWAIRLVDCFGAGNFSVFHPAEFPGMNRHCLSIEEVDEICPGVKNLSPEETLIECHLMGRYYGPGYERGDLSLYISVAQWLEEVIPGARIYYGGDSAEFLEPFGEEERQKHWGYFRDNGHSPYRKSFDEYLFKDNEPRPWCELCEQPMVRSEFGSKTSSFFCTGCLYRLQTTDGGATWMGSLNRIDEKPVTPRFAPVTDYEEK